MPRRKELSEPERIAWKDGWEAASGEQQQHERRAVYTNQADRQAFDDGWHERIERIALGYDRPA